MPQTRTSDEVKPLQVPAVRPGTSKNSTKKHTGALLHESSLARTMPTDRILTGRCDMTLVGRARSSD